MTFDVQAEDFKLESKNEPKNVRVVLYANVKAIDEQDVSVVPIGKVIIPRAVLKTSQDCWFSLSDAHLESRGVKSRIIFWKSTKPLLFHRNWSSGIGYQLHTAIYG